MGCQPPEGCHFDVAKAASICDYIEGLKHTKGAWARPDPENPQKAYIKLEPWQKWMLIIPFGFIRPDGARLIRTCYWEVARKNAKSTTSAGVALYLLEEDGEPGAEVYSAATTREQASIVFQQARQQEILTPHPGVQVLAHRLEVTDKTHPAFGGTFKALHAEGSTMDGLNIHAAINDELHAWKRRDVYEVIETATGSRDQSLIWNITTAGVNYDGVCYDTRGYLCQLLDGVLDDPTFWGNIWTIDKGDDWRDREVWVKANPNMNVSVYELDLERKAKKAEAITAEQSAFMNKHLNVWTNAADAWMNMSKWEACGDSSLKIEDFIGEECWTGADLASKNDMASLAILFRRQIDGVDHIYHFVRNYLPERAVMESANAGHYDGWVRSGHLIVTPGVVLDVERIEQDTLDIHAKHPIRECCFDPMHNATQYGVNMQAAGLSTVEVRPHRAELLGADEVHGSQGPRRGMAPPLRSLPHVADLQR